MKYKRISIYIPDANYTNWKTRFSDKKEEFTEYSCFKDIDNINFYISFNSRTIMGDPAIILSILKCSKENRYNNSDERMFWIITNIKQLNDIYTFIYENVTYVVFLRNKTLNLYDYGIQLKNICDNIEYLEPYIYFLDINNNYNIMDICFCFFHSNYDEKKNLLLESFLKKLFYYGIEVYDYDFIYEIDLMPDINKVETMQKEIEYLNFSLKNNFSLSEEERHSIKEKANDVYKRFMLL